MNTQGGKFLKQLQRMEKDIDQTTPRFIRCIKPNQQKVRFTVYKRNKRKTANFADRECLFAQEPGEIHGLQCLRQLRFAVRRGIGRCDTVTLSASLTND